MFNRGKIEKCYGVLFLVIGLVWLGGIYVRSEGYLPRLKTAPKVSYQNIKTQLAERIRAQKEQSKIKPFSLKKHLPEVIIAQFWMIASGEFVCAILFLVTGVALLRAYPLRGPMAVGTLTADLFLKSLVWSYQNCILLPLKDIFDGKNVLFMYFVSDAGPAAKPAAFFAGIPLLRQGAFFYGFSFAAFFILSVWFFANSQTKKPFS